MLGLAVAPASAQDQQARPFMLMNAGPGIVVSVELSAVGQGRYGPSLIGRIELPAGNALHLTPPSRSDCLADVRIRFADGRVEERPSEDFCQAPHVLRVPATPR